MQVNVAVIVLKYCLFSHLFAPKFQDFRDSVLTSEQTLLWRKLEMRFVYRADMKPRLNEREAKICEYVAAGYSNRKIAGRLRLSEQTIKNYLGQIFRKAGIDNRVQLAILYSAVIKKKLTRNPIRQMVTKPKRAKAS